MGHSMSTHTLFGIFCRPSPILLKFGMFVGLDEKMSHNYVNDLNRSLTSGNCIMYADDTNVFLKNKCYEELYKIANQELINIDNWLSANRLILNTNKTHYTVRMIILYDYII